MAGARKFGGFLLTIGLVLGLLPIRPLIMALGVDGSAPQQCLLHGPNCQCAAHCSRTARHSREAHETTAIPACHRHPAGQTPLATNAPSESRDAVPATASECAMTDCGKEAPLLLTSQDAPYLTASIVAGPDRDPGLQALRIAHPFAHFSLEASPPTPPPES